MLRLASSRLRLAKARTFSPLHPLSRMSGATPKRDSPDDEAKKEKLGVRAYLGRAVHGVAVGTKDLLLNPSRIPGLLRETWVSIKETGEHYWIGSKLLWGEMKLANEIIGRLLQGHSMTRRERNQLIRTTMDMFRLIPFAVFVIVPFMELLLPVALTLFPNMLPSTFADTLKKEERMKKELQMRLAIAGFFQDTMLEMAAGKQGKLREEGAGASEVIEFFEKVRLGEHLPNDVVIKMARLFQDELTLPNVARPQLVSMCKYMGLTPFGADAFLRFQLRTKLRAIKEDDRRILWEGLSELTSDEVREACQERGMSAYGLTDVDYKRQLREWLDLSIQKNIPISLLIMSRAFTLSQPDTVPSGAQLRDSLFSLDEDVINEVVLAAAKHDEVNSLDMKTRKLESLQFQQEKIDEEREDSEEARIASKAAKPGPVLLDASANAPGPAVTEPEQKWLLTEVQALSDLVSPGLRERSELQELRERARPLVGLDPESDASAVKDSELERMKRALDAMLGTLTAKLSSTEAYLAEKLKLLDLDMDGELSVLELKSAIAQILKRATTDKEAEDLVQLLDKDRDGKVSVSDLMRYVEERRETHEVDELEAQVKTKQAASGSPLPLPASSTAAAAAAAVVNPPTVDPSVDNSSKAEATSFDAQTGVKMTIKP